MINRKCFVMVFVLLFAFIFTIPVHAEETVSDTETAEDWATKVMQTVENYENGDVNIIYTADSVLRAGLYVDSGVDVLTRQVYLVISTDLPAGYVVYDNPNTTYIDGIRVNGKTVDTYRVPIDYTQNIDYEVIVKITYAEGFTGTLAQMSDGTYNWTQLLENPVGLLMALYYILATVAVLSGIFAAWRGKNKKVKTADEISKAVTTAADSAASKAIDEQVMPVVTAFQSTAQALVKAFALTTSKSKEAPTALLDVLQTVSSTDAVAAIDQARQLLENDRNAAEAARQETIDKLHNIAHTVQEVPRNETTDSESQEKEDVAIF